MSQDSQDKCTVLALSLFAPAIAICDRTMFVFYALFCAVIFTRMWVRRHPQ